MANLKDTTINGKLNVVQAGNAQLYDDIRGRINCADLTYGTVSAARLPAASTTAAGIAKLNIATNSTSTAEAATPSAVKAAYDLANGREPAFSKNTAFNKNFEATASVYKAPGTAAVGTSSNVARADHVHPAQTSVSGNAGTASKWATARTITLGGDLSGSVSIDGSTNVTLTGAVTDDSHNHTTLAGKYGGAIIFNDLGNGNVTVCGSKTSAGVVGDLYLGYNSGSHGTKDILLCKNLKWSSNGAVLVDSTGKIPWSNLTGLPDTWKPSTHSHDDLYYPKSTSDGRYLYRSADSTLTGKIVASGTDRTSGMYGTYDSAKISQIWSMGTAYKIDAAGANFGTLYGLAYKHTNNGTGGTMAGGHQMVWCNAGTPKVALGDGIWTSGNIGTQGRIWVDNIGASNVIGGAGPHGTSAVTNLNSIWKSGFYEINGGSNQPFGEWNWVINVAHTSNNSGYRYGMQIAAQNGTGNFAMRTTNVNGEGAWHTLFHTGKRPYTYGTGSANNSDGMPDGNVYFKYV